MVQRARVIVHEKTWLYAGNLFWTCARFIREPKETISREVGYILEQMICRLSNQQLDVLTGLILGDGYLEYNGYRGTRLQVKQSEERKEYVFWLYSQFAHITKTPPQ